MINLYQYPSYWGLPSGSPFCTKLETYLKLANIPYKTVITYDPRPAPKQKLPYIKDGEKLIPDSSLIINYLKNTYGDKLDQDLSPEQKAIALGIQRLCEEHLFWFIVYDRWVDDKGWEITKPAFFSKLGFPLRLFLPSLIRKDQAKACLKQGVGRFTEEERFLLGKQNIDAIVELLGHKNYFFGDKPSSIDATVWAFMTSILNTPVPSKLREYANNIQNLKNYDARMKVFFSK